MTNLQIICSEIELHGITEEVDTYQGWKRRGYQVQKGEKALFGTRIWKPCKTGGEAEDPDGTRLILVKASFFGRSQVATV